MLKLCSESCHRRFSMTEFDPFSPHWTFISAMSNGWTGRLQTWCQGIDGHPQRFDSPLLSCVGCGQECSCAGTVPPSAWTRPTMKWSTSSNTTRSFKTKSTACAGSWPSWRPKTLCCRARRRSGTGRGSTFHCWC